MLKETNEDLKIHLEKLGVPDHAWISKWFMMLFLYSLPLDVICRVWDFMFSEESLLALIKISLALMKILKPDLLKFDEIFEIMEYFKILKGGLYEPYQSVFLEENAGKSQKINLKGDILVRKARKIKLTRKMIGETAREFIKLNPKFEKHVILEYYTRFDLIEFKEIKIMECKIRDYFQQEDEKVDKINYRLSFENLPILSENDEFLGVNKMKKIPVFDINNLVIFKKNKKPNKENQSDDEEEESNSEEEFSTAKAIKCSDKMNFV